MKFRHLISIAALALLTVTAGAATIVVPAAGTGPGAGGSQWQSELTLHNAAPRPATLDLSFHQGTTVLGPVEIALGAGQTLSIADVARTQFGVTGGAGALVIETEERTAKSLVVTSRTFNTSPEGEFGQDIPAVNITSAAQAGDIGALTGPSSVTNNRFNFGIYAVESATVIWEVMRADGTVAGSKEATYAAGQHAQYGQGVTGFVGVEAKDNDTVYAHVSAGRIIVYGSIINATGDPTFVPGVRTRDDILIHFAGVDLDENGSVDVDDANGDGVLDAPVLIVKSRFPNYFRLVATGEFGETVAYEIVSSPARAEVIDAQGTILVIAGGDVTASTGELVVKVTHEGSSSLITIPLIFK